MPILSGGNLFAPGPVVSGSKTTAAKCWKYCAYSTQSTDRGDFRVPNGEKTYHEETDGRMHVYSIGGPIGWVCASNDCSFYTGSAITQVTQKGMGSCTTLAGDPVARGRTIVSGTRYFEI